MAKKTVVILSDDLDGSEASESIQFALDGTEYEIDLNNDNANELRGALERKPSGRKSSSSQDGPDAKAVRQWAAKRLFVVGGELSSCR